MQAEARLLIETWEAVRDRLPAAYRAEVAEGIVRAFAEFGMDHKDMADAADEDETLAEALDAVFSDGRDDDDGGYEDFEDFED